MNIGIIGSGTVAQTLGERLLTVGQAVMISARDPDAPKDLGPRGVVPAAERLGDRPTSTRGARRRRAASPTPPPSASCS